MQAFTDALNSTDLDMVAWLAYQVAIGKHSLATVASQLSGVIQVCLLQQLSQQLEVHTALKLTWLDTICAGLKLSDAIVAEHGAGVIAMVCCHCSHSSCGFSFSCFQHDHVFAVSLIG